MTFFSFIEQIGTVAFAMSGALTAMSKKFDPFGVFIIAFVTAVGGGTLRDVLIGNTPVSWMLNFQNVYLIILAFSLSIVFRKKFDKLRISLFLFDTIGLGVFTLIGVQKGVDVGLESVICIILGTVTACFGGVIRDILCNEIPVVFHKEIYATICILGGVEYFLLKELPLTKDVILTITMLTIIVVRLLAVRFKWYLPSFDYKA